MTADHRLLSVFADALDRTDPAARAAYLDAACGAAGGFRDQVEALLAAHAGVGRFLQPGPADPGATVTAAPATPAAATATADWPGRDEHVGAVLVGKYKLTEVIGEGGMGAVYLAQQTEPVRRAVAVKVIKAGMDSKAVLARFEAERQALALMDHPNIARVLDAGTTDSGRPFFVMELVKGVPITQYCDERRLTPRQRLELFVPVCHAIQHAHQKGVIHRDVKPSNVLVALYDDRPVPKVIDFGVAKAAGQTLTDKTLLTGFGAVVGTPEYMSPEQASLNNLDIDTRSDVYSLGVLLYELLTGSTPVDRKSLGKAALLEVLRIVREVEAPKPSAKLSTLDTLPSVAANRGTEPARLSRLMKGELDWLVLKALEKDRTRRYETANGLAADVQRYLAGEPVQAVPPSAGYRLRKFVRKNRGPVVAVTMVLFALLTGIVSTTLGLLEAKRQETLARGEAEEKERQRALAEVNEGKATQERAKAETAAAAEKAARLDEERERKFAQAINAFVRDDFLALTSVEGQDRFGGEGLDRNATLIDLLTRAADKLKARRNLDPKIEAELCWIVGVNYRGAGDAAKGVPFLERAVELRRTLLPPDHPDLLDAMNSLGVCYGAAGREDKARPLFEETLARHKVIRGLNHRTTLVIMGNLASCYRTLGQLDTAVPLLEETLRLKKTLQGPNDPSTLESMGGLAKGYQEAGQLDKALPLFEEAYARQKERLGPDHPSTYQSLGALALCLKEAGRLDKAMPMLEQTAALLKAKLGPDHPHTLTSMDNLAGGYWAAGRLDTAVPLLEETLTRRTAKLGPDHPDTLNSMWSLAEGYKAAGGMDKALPLLETAVALYKAKLGLDNSSTLTCLGSLASSYRIAGQLDKALPMLEEALKLSQAKRGPDHPHTLTCMNNLALGYRDAKQLEKAIPLFEETLRLEKAKKGPDHPGTITCMNNLALAYHDAAQPEKAIPLFEETLRLSKSKNGPDHPDTLNYMNNLASSYGDAGLVDKALPLLVETLRLRTIKLGPDHPDTLNSMHNLAETYREAGRLEQALPLFEKTLAGRKAKFGLDHRDTLASMAHLAGALEQAGHLDKAIPLYEETLRLRKDRLGPDHPDTLMSLNNLAVGYWNSRQLDKSIPLFQEVVRLQEKKYGRNHPVTLNDLINLGVNCADAARYSEAIPLMEEAFRASSKITSARWASGPLVDAYYKSGNTAAATKMLDELLADPSRGLPKGDPQLPTILSNYGLTLLEMRRYADAETLLRESLALREKAQPNSWRVFNVQSLLGGAILGQRRYADAEPLLAAGYEGMKQREKAIPPQAATRIPEALDRLIELYAATDKPDDLKKWRAERSAYPKERTPPPREKK